MSRQDEAHILREELSEAYALINHLQQQSNTDFESSPEYKRMKQEIHALKLSESLAEQHIETGIRQDRRLIEEIKKIREDNVELCAEHGAEYWEGITRIYKQDYKDIRDMEKKIIDLESKIVAKDVIIEHFKDLLAGRDPLAPKETVMGRKPIPDDQKKRIRAYRRKGWTVKEISEMEGVSIGSVSSICKDISITKNS
ncbi:MAG: hypothetical protein K6F35_12670 [Lachnospiraceae bacterium]|nr:hypothetical protein [Lachnospiraceae bacterium]